MKSDNNAVSCSVEGQVLVVNVLVEQLRDITVVQAMREGVIAAIEESQTKNVVIDLSNVKHIGSVAFLAFLAIRRQGNVDRIVLCNLSEFVQELFRMCKLIATGNGKSAPFEQTANRTDAIAMCLA
ncbi:MAG: STAS domain-containing protein [Pirellulaceae bacterium]|nr:STAS domain-containing protein [Pirellulaceae bacterium]